MPGFEVDDPLSRDIYSKMCARTSLRLADTRRQGHADPSHDVGQTKPSKDPWAYAHIAQQPLDLLDYRPDHTYNDVRVTFRNERLISAGVRSDRRRVSRRAHPADDPQQLTQRRLCPAVRHSASCAGADGPSGGSTEFSEQAHQPGFYHSGAYDEPSQALERRAY